MRGPNAYLRLTMLLSGALALAAAWGQSPPVQSAPAPAASPAPTTAPTPAQQPASKAGSPAKPASGSGASTSTRKAAAAAPAKSAGPPAKRSLPNRFAGRAGVYYKAVWGIDSLVVRWAESGELIRFSWRVLDPQKAQVLNDKRLEPALIDPRAGVSLVIPTMEKIGQLRQSQAAEAGKSYWMAFSNKGRLVKRGDRVDVVIGTFKAENLVVD